MKIIEDMELARMTRKLRTWRIVAVVLAVVCAYQMTQLTFTAFALESERVITGLQEDEIDELVAEVNRLRCAVDQQGRILAMEYPGFRAEWECKP